MSTVLCVGSKFEATQAYVREEPHEIEPLRTRDRLTCVAAACATGGVFSPVFICRVLRLLIAVPCSALGLCSLQLATK